MRDMKSYGQFCSIAKALEIVGERWTLLIGRVPGRGVAELEQAAREARLSEAP
jgi:DNA-binding HxlR family transcriptional regulator